MKILQASFNRPLRADDLLELASIRPQLVLVFGSVALISHAGLLESLRLGFPDAELAGCSTAGEISDRFDVSKPTMSAHFAVLKEADLVHTEKAGKSVIYHLKLSVLEEALLGFVHSFGLGGDTPEPGKGTAK
jgi:DNA-binding transcriptional ArsR family regulator